MSSLAHASIHGVAWTLLRVLGQTGIGFGVGIYLARTLEVRDFGLMAIAMSLIGFSELLSGLGVEASLIQRPTLTPKHLSVAFLLSLAMALLLFLLFALLGIPLAHFFDQPELAKMLPVLGLGQCFATMGMVPRAILRRRFDYKKLSKIELAAYMLGYALTSIALTLAGFGVWGMVLGTVAWFFLSCIFLYRAANTRLRPAWSLPEVRDLLNFGVLITVKSAINYLSFTVSDFMIGKFFGPAQLGLYSRAQQVAQLPLQKIASVFSSVMFPIYASIQNEPRRLAEAYLKTVAVVSLLTMPPLAVMSVGSELLITGLYGEKWLPAAPVLSLLCLAAMLVCVLHLAGALVEANNQVWTEVKYQTVYFCMKVVGFCFAVRGELVHMALVMLLGALFLYLVMGRLAQKIIDSNWIEFFKVQAPGVVIALLLAGAAALFLPFLEQMAFRRPVALAILVAYSALLYGFVLWLMPDRWLFGAKQMIVAKFLRRRSAEVVE